LRKLRGLDTVETSQHVAALIDKERPDAVVIDGDGIGAGVVDQLHHRGYRNRGLHEFHGGARPLDPFKYFNRRAEIWGLMGDWLAAGAEIPDDPEVDADLTGVQYGYSSKSQIQLEKKEDMKSRGLASPDLGDCLAMTFAVKVSAVKKPYIQRRPASYGVWT